MVRLLQIVVDDAGYPIDPVEVLLVDPDGGLRRSFVGNDLPGALAKLGQALVDEEGLR